MAHLLQVKAAFDHGADLARVDCRLILPQRPLRPANQRRGLPGSEVMAGRLDAWAETVCPSWHLVGTNSSVVCAGEDGLCGKTAAPSACLSVSWLGLSG